MKGTEIMEFEQVFKELKELAEKNDGVVKVADILKYAQADSEDYDKLEHELQMAGFDIVSDELSESEILDEGPDLKALAEEEPIDIEKFDILPPTIKVDDPVRMYLREIGKAIICCDKAIAFNPNWYRGYFLRGDIKIFEMNMFNDGLLDLERALALCNVPKDKADIYALRATAYEQKAFEELVSFVEETNSQNNTYKPTLSQKTDQLKQTIFPLMLI